MTRQPDDIRRYIRLTESSSVELEDDLDHIEVPDINDSVDLMLEDINDMVFKFRSYSEADVNPDYARGIEEGLALAANMLESLLERHSGNSSK